MANSIKVKLIQAPNRRSGKVDNNAEINRQIEIVKHLDRKSMRKGGVPTNLATSGDSAFIVSLSALTDWVFGEVCNATLAMANTVTAVGSSTDINKSIIGIIIAGNNGDATNDVVVLTAGSGYALKNTGTGKAIVAGDMLMCDPADYRKVIVAGSEDTALVILQAEDSASESDKYVRVRFATPASGGGGTGGVASVPAIITSKGVGYYLCDVYGDGPDFTKTQSAQKVYILQLNFADTLKNGTWIMVNPSQIGTTGAGIPGT